MAAGVLELPLTSEVKEACLPELHFYHLRNERCPGFSVALTLGVMDGGVFT